MFYPLIARKRDQWLAHKDCPVRAMLGYMRDRGKLRPVQIDAIATYLFLKIACDGKPLWQIFAEGYLVISDLCESSQDLDRLSLTGLARRTFIQEPGFRALYEVATTKTESGATFIPRLREALTDNPKAFDCEAIFKRLFYNVSYADYLFSLPMGAGKTYLMAALIYLNLHFAVLAPEDASFAHNFLILAPSGTKSSIVPSLRKIQSFDPSWVFPEEEATRLKRLVKFEVLDRNASSARSNRTRNPNAQKIAAHEPFPHLMGLVAVVNAEKVILDRLPKGLMQDDFFESTEDARDRAANELRALLGKIPHLALLVDEAHHVPTAVRQANAKGDDLAEIRLRSVIHHWSSKSHVTEVLGFSGTPYLEKADTIDFGEGVRAKSSEMTNVVHHYPLVRGIGTFLKRPVVYTHAGCSAAEIVTKGVRQFFETYRDTVYADGTCAKLAIYGGTIERTETILAPLIRQLLAEAGLPDEALLIHHQGNKEYPTHPGSEVAFASLDRPQSRIRIVLLVQIGKEGWDCRSLTGVILSQEGDCNTTMVLQTTCRCLREVSNAYAETALIVLNSANAHHLQDQLHKQQRIDLTAFQAGVPPQRRLKVYDRTAALGLDTVTLPFRQLRVRYTEVVREANDPAQRLDAIQPDAYTIARSTTYGTFMEMHERSIEDAPLTPPERADFWLWRCQIVRESLGMLPMATLRDYLPQLERIFTLLSYKGETGRVYRRDLNHADIRAAVRRAFVSRRKLETEEHFTLVAAQLLTDFYPEEVTERPERYHPAQDICEEIVARDTNGNAQVDEKLQQAINLLRQAGYHERSEELAKSAGATDQYNARHTYHYLPYRMDSGFEKRFLEVARRCDILEHYGLTLLYNGDDRHTTFRIDCYAREENRWVHVGKYTPDFLLLRKKGNRIAEALIIETKGEAFINDPGFLARRDFMETFKTQQVGEDLPKYHYTVLPEVTDERDLDHLIRTTCKNFFSEP